MRKLAVRKFFDFLWTAGICLVRVDFSRSERRLYAMVFADRSFFDVTTSFLALNPINK